ncbi:hypothetical protein ABIE58_002552 [Roseovarius sp. MBR-78]
MTGLKHAYRGASVLVALNVDLLLFVVALVVALMAAGYLGTL